MLFRPESLFVYLIYFIAESVFRVVFAGAYRLFFYEMVLGLKKEGLDIVPEMIEPF